ncbi:MAG: hypothetical protein IPJ51_11790 [Saprospiraceae bacterium]|nr:hypothetical protein [Saprospiraceae bacterium]
MKSLFNLNDKSKYLNTLERISNVDLKEDSHIFKPHGAIPIRKAAELSLQQLDPTDFTPAIIFIRVVLAANRNYNRHVRENVIRIKRLHPQLRSISDLDNLINSMSVDEFYELWGHKNPRKYNVLLNLIKSTKTLREKYNITDDFILLKKWAEDFQILNLRSDEIGKIDDVALATVQHLRMDFGIDTVKPDQRVMEVIEREFLGRRVTQRQAIEFVEFLSSISGLKVRLLDLIMVNYGSGYYANKTFYSLEAYQIEIVKNFAKLGISYTIISEGTSLSLSEVNTILSDVKNE